LLLQVCLMSSPRLVRAEDPPGDKNLNQTSLQVNVPMKTLGGRQLWGDVRFLHGWTIQRNVFTGHFRLLDPRDVRYAWGSFDACKARLELIRRERQLPAMQGEAVILLHGIFRSSKAMQ
jgi:hypothetical protein